MIRIPNIRSAKKRLRQGERRRGLNRARKLALKKTISEIRQHLASGDKDRALSLLPTLAKAADKAAKRNVIHRNKANRIKSRWMKTVQSL